jgi:hypothetical protein
VCSVKVTLEKSNQTNTMLGEVIMTLTAL